MEASVIASFGMYTRPLAVLQRVMCELGCASWFLLQGCENGVTLIPENPFICEKMLGPFDKGIRIDYIMFKVRRSLPLSRIIFKPTNSRLFLDLTGFFQNTHLLWFHVYNQRLRL